MTTDAADRPPGRPRPHPVTGDRHYDPDELELLRAVDDFRRRTGRTFPTICDVLLVAKSLGYAKPAGLGAGPTAR